jgi:hypothetical protein
MLFFLKKAAACIDAASGLWDDNFLYFWGDFI